MNSNNTRKLVVAAMLVALSVALSAFSIPIGASRCFPIQHMANVLAAVFLGPTYGVLAAFCTSLIRNIMGTGTLLAFPGSMAGALCCGLMYKMTKKLVPTYIAEIIGTGILGAILAFPIATAIMGREAAIFTYVIPFLVSTVGGTCIAAVLIGVLDKTKALAYFQSVLHGNA